jgi:hypothetical protein
VSAESIARVRAPGGVMSAQLEQLAVEIEQQFDQSDLGRIKAGQLLLKARELVKAGEAGGNIGWGKWCSAHINRSPGDIRKVMRIARSPDPKAASRAEREAAKRRMAEARERSRGGDGNADTPDGQSAEFNPDMAPEIAAKALAVMPDYSRTPFLIDQIMKGPIQPLLGDLIKRLDDEQLSVLLDLVVRQRWPDKFKDCDGANHATFSDAGGRRARHEARENLAAISVAVEPEITKPDKPTALIPEPTPAAIDEREQSPEIVKAAADRSGTESNPTSASVEPEADPETTVAAVDEPTAFSDEASPRTVADLLERRGPTAPTAPVGVSCHASHSRCRYTSCAQSNRCVMTVVEVAA